MAARTKKPAGKPPDPWVEPLGHTEWLQGLWRAADGGRMPHGLMLIGPSGVGKFTAARWFAAGLFCAEGPGAPCRTCGPCKRFAAGTHADYLEVDARAHGLDALTVAFFAQRKEGRSSGYQGPSVAEFLALRSAEGGARVVLVREAERMNQSAQNAFLKTLEEPSPGTVLVLECSQPGALLPTMLSRVVRLSVPAPPPNIATEILHKNGIDPADAGALVRMAHGSPGLALVFHRQSRLALRGLLAARLAGELGAVETRRRVMELDGDFDGKTPAAAKRLRASRFLDLALEVMHEAERAAAGVDRSQLAHGEFLDPLLTAPRSRRRQALDQILSVRQDVGLNLGAETLLDRALLALPSTAAAR